MSTARGAAGIPAVHGGEEVNVHRSEQVYAHLGHQGPLAVVGYEGRHRGYQGELLVGADGLLERYPGLGRRIA
jgi:hypothetical protein